MSTTTIITRDKDGRYLMLVTMDTEGDALAVAAGLGTVSVSNIRKGASDMTPAQLDKIEQVLERKGFATPLYSMYDQLLTALS